MDNLKTLMDRKDYEMVIKLTENTSDMNFLFYRISAFLAMGKGQDALSCIQVNRQILQHDMSLLVKIHIEILCLLGMFDEAYKELEYYKNLPYVSQEVEELLRDMPNFIREEEKKLYLSKELNEEKLKEKLKSKEQSDVLAALDLVRNKDVNHFLSEIQNIMINFPKQVVRSFALLLLVDKKLNLIVKFNHLGEIVNVNPAKLEAPFIGDEFNKFLRNMQTEFKNPAVSQDTVQILSSYIIYIYPEKVTTNYPVLMEALRNISYKYLRIEDEYTLEQRCEMKNLDVDEVKDLIQRINDSLNDF